MSNDIDGIDIDNVQVAEFALRALMRNLKEEGHDIEALVKSLTGQVLDDSSPYAEGKNPHYKMAAVSLLEKCCAEIQ